MAKDMNKPIVGTTGLLGFNLVFFRALITSKNIDTDALPLTTKKLLGSPPEALSEKDFLVFLF